MTEIAPAQSRARVWILLALDACDRAGLVPMSKTLFHRLIFLSNCLAEIYEAAPPSKRVVKYIRGPFYPDVQWQLDRLNAMGLVSIHDLSIVQDKHGPWMLGDYSITHAGIDTAYKIRRKPLGQSITRYIDELVFAFARLNGRRLEEIALNELNYSAEGIAEGFLITFDDAQSNLALRKTNDFERVAPVALAARVREKVQLYLRYIETVEGVA